MNLLFPFDLNTESEWGKLSSGFPISIFKEVLAEAMEENLDQRHYIKRKIKAPRRRQVCVRAG